MLVEKDVAFLNEGRNIRSMPWQEAIGDLASLRSLRRSRPGRAVYCIVAGRAYVWNGWAWLPSSVSGRP